MELQFALLQSIDGLPGLRWAKVPIPESDDTVDGGGVGDDEVDALL